MNRGFNLSLGVKKNWQEWQKWNSCKGLLFTNPVMLP